MVEEYTRSQWKTIIKNLQKLSDELINLNRTALIRFFSEHWQSEILNHTTTVLDKIIVELFLSEYLNEWWNCIEKGKPLRRAKIYYDEEEECYRVNTDEIFELREEITNYWKNKSKEDMMTMLKEYKMDKELSRELLIHIYSMIGLFNKLLALGNPIIVINLNRKAFRREHDDIFSKLEEKWSQ